MQTPKILPPHYFVLSILLMAGIAVVAGRGLFDTPFVYLGVLPMLIGVAIAVKASRQFSAAGTNIIPLSQSSALVVDGMFQWSRNPMYTGMILFLSGLAIVLDNGLCWAVVAVFIAIIRQRFVVHEEQLMAETFADDYHAYKASVRRWL